MSDSEPEALEWKVLKQLLNKAHRGQCSEREARALLKLFGLPIKEVHPREKPRQRRTIDDVVPSPEGLWYAASHYGKDVRTIRRWCELGYFPAAKRTAGGHWRIPFKAIDEARTRLPGNFVRRRGSEQKSVFKTEAWRYFRQRWILHCGQLMIFAREIQAGLNDLGSAEFRRKKFQVTEEAFAIVGNAAKKGIAWRTRLALAARRVRVDNPSKPITTAALIRELGMRRATFYRKYSASELTSAKRGAENPLPAQIKEPRQVLTATSFAESVRDYLQEQEGYDASGSKVVFGEGVITELAKPSKHKHA